MKRYVLLLAFLFCNLHLQASSVALGSDNLIGLVRINQVKSWNLDQVEALINSGIDINTQDEDGFTALHWAVFNQKIEVVRELIRLSADLNIQDKYGNTSFHLAVSVKNEEIQELLVDSGADLTVKNDENKRASDYVDKVIIIEKPSQQALKVADQKIAETKRAAGEIEEVLDVEKARLEEKKRAEQRAEAKRKEELRRRCDPTVEEWHKMRKDAVAAKQKVDARDKFFHAVRVFNCAVGKNCEVKIERYRKEAIHSLDCVGINTKGWMCTSRLEDLRASEYLNLYKFWVRYPKSEDKGPAGLTLLHQAVMRGDKGAVMFLMGYDARSNYDARLDHDLQLGIKTDAGETALELAERIGEREIADILRSEMSKRQRQKEIMENHRKASEEKEEFDRKAPVVLLRRYIATTKSVSAFSKCCSVFEKVMLSGIALCGVAILAHKVKPSIFSGWSFFGT